MELRERLQEEDLHIPKAKGERMNKALYLHTPEAVLNGNRKGLKKIRNISYGVSVKEVRKNLPKLKCKKR